MGRYGEIWGDMGRYREIWGGPSSAGRSRPAHVPTQSAIKERATANLKRSTSWHASSGARQSAIATQPEMTGAPQRAKACAARSERLTGGPPASACWYERRTSAVGGVMSAGVTEAMSASLGLGLGLGLG